MDREAAIVRLLGKGLGLRARDVAHAALLRSRVRGEALADSNTDIKIN